MELQQFLTSNMLHPICKGLWAVAANYRQIFKGGSEVVKLNEFIDRSLCAELITEGCKMLGG